ncbi:MAG: GIN domain-containing protein [Sphingosinicella sp.]|uniref:GIN domain-containing protein n=1 Tax=Sphingosinicella sp. TaxID=1917971 RepID=UPI0040379776
MTRRFALIAGAALAVCGPAGAQTPVALERFDQIELRGGGTVTVRQGAEQRVTMLRGDPALTRFRVEDDRLTIDACVRSCRDYDLEIEIVVPEIDAVAIEGGGHISTQGGFGDPRELVAAVSGGGMLDLRSINAVSVTAAVQGGGSIRARARTNLVAAVQGGGSITYWGDPAVVSNVSGGGSVRSGEGR